MDVVLWAKYQAAKTEKLRFVNLMSAASRIMLYISRSITGILLSDKNHFTTLS